MAARLSAALAVVVIAAAGAAPAQAGSGVRGDVKVGPTCPVERDPPDPACAPRGYSTVVRARANGRLVKKGRTDAGGRFKLRLAPGRYELSARSGSGGYPRCEAQAVSVKRGHFTRVHLFCDSGLR